MPIDYETLLKKMLRFIQYQDGSTYVFYIDRYAQAKFNITDEELEALKAIDAEIGN